MKKKRIFLIAVVLCCLALMGMGTLAYFTAKETAYNVITTGELSMELIERQKDGSPFPETPITGVMPGDEISKIVTVKNTGNVDFYARVKIDSQICDAEGNADTLSMDEIALDYNKENWMAKGDYYYYDRALSPGEESTPLFMSVTFDPEMNNAYQSATLTIDVQAEAVQSKNNTDSPLTAAGWGSN